VHILSSRFQNVLRDETAGRLGSPRIVRVVVSERSGADLPRVVLSPGDRLVVRNDTDRTLAVTPLDFFGTTFTRAVLEPGECTPALVVTGLWVQVELHAAGRAFFPLDVYLAPNATA
jgi:hypothetical protein